MRKSALRCPAMLRRIGAAFAVAVVVFIAPARAQRSAPRIEITFAPAARPEAVTGMVYVAIASDNKRTPIEQASPTGAPLFSTFVDGLKPGSPAVIDAEPSRPSVPQPRRPAARRVLGAAVRQRLHAVRARGWKHGVDAHGSVGRAELEAIARQSLWRSGRVRIDPASPAAITLVADKVIPPIARAGGYRHRSNASASRATS